MSNFSKTNTLWSFEKGVVKQEPFEETALKECTPDQLRMKIEFLEKNITLLRCECEALELHSIKLQPELFQTNEIDTSWMPYNFSKEKRQPILKVIKTARKMSMMSTKSTRSYSGSMYSIVKKAVNNKKISMNHMIFVMEKVLMILDMDFGKHCNVLSLIEEKLKNEIESVKMEYSRMLQYIDSYKAIVLDPGYDLLTKRIPSDRYVNFIKKHLFASDNAINEYRLRINDVINKKKMLGNLLKEMQIIREKVSDSDFMQAKLVHKNLTRKERDTIALKKEIEELRRKVRMTYYSKMYKLEQFERDLGLEILDVEINNYRKKTLVSITEDVDDNELFETHYTVPKEVLNKQIDTYMKAKLYNTESDKRIKMMEDKLERQKQTEKIYCQLLKKLNIKKD